MFFKEIKNCLDNENYLGALAITLILPEVFGKYEYEGCIEATKRCKKTDCNGNRCDGRYCVNIKYQRWYDENVRKFDLTPMPIDSDGKNLIDYKILDEQHNRVIDGYIVYKLRNRLFHEGSSNVEDEYRGKHLLDRKQNFEFVLSTKFATSYQKTWVTGENEDFPDYKVRINVIDLCRNICSVAEEIYNKNPKLNTALNGITFKH